MKRVLLFTTLLFTLLFVQGQPLRIAVAANAQFVIKELQADFKKKTGIETEAIIGSSGNLATQIKNGAPFDIFLSADMDFPATLFKEGFAITQPKEYALGSLIVCTNKNIDLKDWRQLLGQEKTQKIAIANTELAPYGKAAQQALTHYGLWDAVKPRLVFGESISQVNTYITTGVVTLGFTTEALIYEYPEKNKLKWIRVDNAVYEKIRQGVVLLSYSKKQNAQKAKQFYNYLFSAPAKKIFKNYGYRES